MSRGIGSKGRRLATGLLLSVLLAGIFAASAGAASPAVAWQIQTASLPTNLIPGTESSQFGPKYEAFVTNVGGAAAAGVTLTDILPVGVTTVASPSLEPAILYLQSGTVSGSCSVSGQVVSCGLTGDIAPGSSFKVTIPLAVSATAPSVISNEVSVEGGGARASSKLSTLVTSTPSPFAIASGSGVSAVVSDEAGNVPSAGTQPFVTTINVAVTTKGVGIPTEAMRTVGVELPQGLTVDPRATTKRCKMSEMALNAARNPSSTCPPESQVGRAYLVTNGNAPNTKDNTKGKGE